MNSEVKRTHWDQVYATKQLNEVSWYQSTPEISLNLIKNAQVSKDTPIIDVGGGDGFLVDNLLDLGYTNITVLDISANAIRRAQERLRERSELVKWVISDIVQFKPEQEYGIWHDRAVFHFLTKPEEISEYQLLVTKTLSDNGTMILGTFSDTGPLKCSGLEVSRYSQDELAHLFENTFHPDELLSHKHNTPFDTVQDFSFVRFQKK